LGFGAGESGMDVGEQSVEGAILALDDELKHALLG
jgi:hypothetical protein